MADKGLRVQLARLNAEREPLGSQPLPLGLAPASDGWPVLNVRGRVPLVQEADGRGQTSRLVEDIIILNHAPVADIRPSPARRASAAPASSMIRATTSAAEDTPSTKAVLCPA